MTSVTDTYGTLSPRQTDPSLGLQAPEAGRRTAWIDIFADQAVRHMAGMGVMSLKATLEKLIEEDSKQDEYDTRQG